MNIIHAVRYDDHVMRFVRLESHWWLVAGDAANALDATLPLKNLLSRIPNENLREIECEDGVRWPVIAVRYLILHMENAQSPEHIRFQRWLRGWKIIHPPGSAAS